MRKYEDGNEQNVSSAAWWNARYQRGDTGWNKGAVAPPIERLLREGIAPRGRVAVLGAGHGHEALAAAAAGYAVTAIDFAEAATAAVRTRARDAAVEIEALTADVFDLPRSHPEAFDAALEHTCYCAIDPARREVFARAVHDILRPGAFFFGLFYAHGRSGGPPYTTTEAELRRFFTPLFDVIRLRVAPDSIPGRANEELEFIFRKRAR